jgi:hypothetical protein
VSTGIIFQSALGLPIVAGTAYVSLNGGTVARFRRRFLLPLEDEYNMLSRRRLQAAGAPLVTGDCNGDGLFNANDATYAQTLVTNGAPSWPTNSLSQMRSCAPTYSYMFNALQASYTGLQIQITIADVQYLLSASTNRLFFLNISSPYDLVSTVPTFDNQPWEAIASYYYFPASTAVTAYTAAPCATISGYFEMNVASVAYTLLQGTLYGNSSVGVVFEGVCASDVFTVSIATSWQETFNLSLGFINNATGDAYAFFGMDVGSFINPNTNFVNVQGSTIVSGPIYTFSGTHAPSSAAPVTLSPTTLSPTASPSSASPSTASPSTASPSTASPSTAPTVAQVC